jgi:hypothetical protein
MTHRILPFLAILLLIVIGIGDTAIYMQAIRERKAAVDTYNQTEAKLLEIRALLHNRAAGECAVYAGR